MVEKSDLDTEVTPYSCGPVLPKDVPVMKDSRGEGPKEVTWDHPNHGDFTTEQLCDVCNGKMSLEDFVSAKVSREEGSKKSGDSSRRRSDKERKKHHSRRDKHSSSNTSHSSLSKDKSHSSSSKDKSQTSSKDKSKSHSSTHSSSRDKSHGISSNSKSHSSSSKENSSSSSSKDECRSKSSRESSSGEKKQSSLEKDNEKPHSRSKSLGLNSDAGASKVEAEKADLQARVNKATAAIEAAAAEVEAEKADLQARINKVTAAIEAAKMSGNELLDQIGESSSQEVESGSPPAHALDLDLPNFDDVERGDGGRRYSSGAGGEVSSTVTIASPEQWEVENTLQEPSVWEGQVIMQDIAKFSVSAYQVSGTCDYLREDLETSLTLVGTISPSVCLEYIEKISKMSSLEIQVMRLGLSNNDDKEAYQEFFKNLSIKDRYVSTPPSLE